MEPNVDPAAVGLDTRQLATLDRHFAAYVDDGRLAGWQMVVTRKGEIAHHSTYGLADLESDSAVTEDTLWRIYSMTKPITTVAAMMLWEEGRFELTDEISRWLLEFADVRVFDKGSIASTAFWIDPIEELTVLFFTQLIPSSEYPIRPQLRQLIYPAVR